MSRDYRAANYETSLGREIVSGALDRATMERFGAMVEERATRYRGIAEGYMSRGWCASGQEYVGRAGGMEEVLRWIRSGLDHDERLTGVL
jgi:hypothetical protein